MEYKLLGRTGLRVSPLGMGAVQITRLDWKDSIRMVREVMDMGINWFDTAERAVEGGGKGYRRAGNETLRRGTDHRCRAV